MTGAGACNSILEEAMGGIGSGMKALYTRRESEDRKRLQGKLYMRRQRKLQRDGKWRKRIGRVQGVRQIEQNILREALIAPWI
jgi:hypothetical protein